MNDKVPITNAIGASWNAAWNISVQVNINVTSFSYMYIIHTIPVLICAF